jgi:hypothetical protein
LVTFRSCTWNSITTWWARPTLYYNPPCEEDGCHMLELEYDLQQLPSRSNNPTNSQHNNTTTPKRGHKSRCPSTDTWKCENTLWPLVIIPFAGTPCLSVWPGNMEKLKLWTWIASKSNDCPVDDRAAIWDSRTLNARISCDESLVWQKQTWENASTGCMNRYPSE